MEQKHIVIFGASGASAKVADMLDSIHTTYDFFVDNNFRKWGTIFKGKEVMPPDELRNGNYNIIIASTYQAQIEEQLKNMRLYENIIWKEQIMLDYIEEHQKELSIFKNSSKRMIEQDISKRFVIMDLEYGLGLGGTESWVFDISKELLARGIQLEIFTKKTKYEPPISLKYHVTEFAETYENYWDTVKEMVHTIENYLPCSIVINAYNQIMFAAVIAKRLFGSKVKLVLMVHNDNLYVYRRVQLLLPYFDIVSGVSKKIIKCLENNFSVEKKKICYKESAVTYEENLIKTYTLDNNSPLIIGFAGRIQIEQKRCDLIEKLVNHLEKMNCNFILKIAGTGSYIGHLEEYASHSGRIKLLGNIPRHEMPFFWKSCDVYLSLSDYEGASLSLLEAMSYGVVPVVTKVSGVDEFVENKINGFFCSVEDVEGLAECIKYLEQNRNTCVFFGENARNVIKDKCKKDDYISYIETLVR